MTDEEAKQAEVQAMIFCIQAKERQETGKRNIVIDPDYMSIYVDEKNGCYYDFEEDGSLTFYNKDKDDEININIPGFADWRDEYRPILIASECGEEYQFDFDDWNKRGRVFMKELRKQLPENFALYYRHVYEDKGHWGEEEIIL